MQARGRYNPPMRGERERGGSGTGACGLAMAAALLGGMGACAEPHATVRVQQPHLSGRQQDLSLTTVRAAYAPALSVGDARWHVLLRFPPTGATTGAETYVVYLLVPDPAENAAVAYAVGETAPAHGFLHQLHGRTRGLALITQGFVWMKRLARGRWSLRIDVECADGAHITGDADIVRDDYDVQTYVARHYAADVAKLETAPAGAAEPPP